MERGNIKTSESEQQQSFRNTVRPDYFKDTASVIYDGTFVANTKYGKKNVHKFYNPDTEERVQIFGSKGLDDKLSGLEERSRVTITYNGKQSTTTGSGNKVSAHDFSVTRG